MLTFALPHLMADTKISSSFSKFRISLPLKSLQLKSLTEVTLRRVLSTLKYGTEIVPFQHLFRVWRQTVRCICFLSLSRVTPTYLTAASLAYLPQETLWVKHSIVFGVWETTKDMHPFAGSKDVTMRCSPSDVTMHPQVYATPPASHGLKLR